MTPTPTSVWLYTGSWPFSVYGVKAAQIARRYTEFQGAGWYAKYGMLIEETGVLRDGEMTYRVSSYDGDPRDAMAAASALPEIPLRDACEQCRGERGGVPGNENHVDDKILCDYCTAEEMK